MKNGTRKPNPILGVGLLLAAAVQLDHHFGFLPGAVSCFLMGVSLGLMLLGVICADEGRAARLRAWKRNLIKGGDQC